MMFRRAIISLSTILLIGTIMLWIRSPRQSYVFAFRSPRGYLNGVASDRGGILFVDSGIQVDGEYGPADSKGRQTIRNYTFLSVPAEEFAALHAGTFDPAGNTWGVGGFRAASGDFALFSGPPPNPFHALLIPYWFVVLISAPLPLVAGRRLIQRRRWKRQGRCLNCGYDMRASAGRCPECGSEANRQIPATTDNISDKALLHRGTGF